MGGRYGHWGVCYEVMAGDFELSSKHVVGGLYFLWEIGVAVAGWYGHSGICYEVSGTFRTTEWTTSGSLICCC